MIKVLHVNTYDVGGAATACKRIHLGLLNKGIESKILLLSKTKNIPETYSFKIIKSELIHRNFFLSQFDKLLKRIYKKKNKKKIEEESAKKKDFEIRKKGIVYFSFPTSLYDITEHPLYKEADIIQLNWVSGFLDEPSFFRKNTKPVIWRMADLYACGGGNHCEVDCPFDLIKQELEENLKIRANALKDSYPTFVAISNWVKDKADNSKLIGRFPKIIIHNGVDLSIFKPHNKKFAREVFNIPFDKKVLLFGSAGHHRAKGKDILTQTLNLLDADNIQLVTFGNHLVLNESVKYPILNIGPIEDERLLSILYSAADFFIMPSLEEAFGQVTIEALASGTPVVSFPNGGSLDIIKNKINGILAEDFTAIHLKNAIIEAFLINFDSEVIVNDVRQRFNIEDKVDEYIKLYRSLLP